MRRSVALIPILMCLAACSPSDPSVFNMPVEEAYERLNNNRLDDFKFAAQCGILIHIHTVSNGSNEVKWYVTSENVDMLNFTATLTPVEDNRTKVSLALSKGPNGEEAYNGNQVYPRPAIQAPARPIIWEAISAALEGRKFDMWNVKGRGQDSVCSVQRAGLEGGSIRFSVHDKPGETNYR